MSKESSFEITVLIEASRGIDELERYELSLLLQNELLETDIDYVKKVRKNEAIPSRAKSSESVTIGAFLLGVSVATIPSVIQLIQAWLLRQKDQTIRVKIHEIELEVPRSASQAEINEIIGIIETIPERR